MKKKVRRLLSFLLIIAMIFSLAPANAFAGNGGSSGGGHNETDEAYFYVLKPDYKGSLEDSTLGNFYYVGPGTVTNVQADFNPTGERITNYIKGGTPNVSVDSLTELGVVDAADFYSLIGEGFKNVTWYRTVYASGANSNDNTPIVPDNQPCWHVDGVAGPTKDSYQVLFVIPENGSLVSATNISVGTPISGDVINEATETANKNAQNGQTVVWYFDEECEKEPASTAAIIEKSKEQKGKDILYIYGKYVEDTKYNVTYNWTGLPTGTILYDESGEKLDPQPTVPNDENTYKPGQTITVDTTYTKDKVVYTKDEYGNLNAKYTFSGWTVPNNGVMGSENVKITGEWAEETIAVTSHNVEYSWTGLPTGTILYDESGEKLDPQPTVPNDENTYKPGQTITVDTTYTKDKVVYTKDKYGNLNVKYTFSGWTVPNNGVMGSENVKITGEWTEETIANYSLVYDANGGFFGNDKSIKTVSNLVAGNYDLWSDKDGTKPKDVELPTYGSDGIDTATNKAVVFIGWTADSAAKGKIYSAGEEYPYDTTVTIPKDEETKSTTVYAVWGYDEYGTGSGSGDGIPDAQQVVITPADITVYTGGTGYTGVLDDQSGEGIGTTENGLPEPGYYFILPYELNEKLGTNPEEMVNLSNHLRLNYKDGDGDERSWTLQLYNEGVDAGDNIANEKYVYRLVPDGDKKSARLEIHDGNTTITSDSDFTFDLTALYKEYTMNLYTESVTHNLVDVEYNVSGDSENWTKASDIKGIALGTATLTVRGTNQDDPVTEIQDQVNDTVSRITAEKTDGVTYYTNDSNIPVVNQGEVQLLVDEIVGTAQNDLKEAIVQKAAGNESINITDDYTFDFNYLDLVDTSNGNAYVTMGDGQKMTLFWPYPENMDENDTYYIAHFNGLDRNYNDLDQELANAKIDIYSTDNENLKLDKTDKGIKFTVSSFSPFVLVYDKQTSGGGNTGGGTTPTPPDLNTEDHFSYVVGYEDGMVKPENAITRAEVASIFYRLLKDEVRDENTTDVSGFSDVSASDWYGTTVATLSAMDIVRGYEDGTFRPNAPITRAEFAAIATRFFEETGAEYEPGTFDDVTGDEWFANAIADAVELGLIGGYPDGTVRPNNNITRAEACAVVNRTLGRIPHVDHLLPADEMTTWPDNNPSDWFYADMQEATNGHEYEWTTEQGQKVEEWTEILDKDWEDR